MGYPWPLAPPVLSCPPILIHIQTLARLKLVAWSHQTLILQDIPLILLTTVMCRHTSTYLPEILVNRLDKLSLGIIRLCHHSILREVATVYPIMLVILHRSNFTILLVPDLIHTNLTNDQFNSLIRRILSDQIQV